MANDARQNPANKWGRYSGSGAGGISEVIPTAAEARRGLEPFALRHDGDPGRAIALVATAVAGAVLAGMLLWQARQPKDLPTRVMKRVGLR